MRAGDAIVALSVDKAWIEIDSEHDGVISKYFAEEGDILDIGGPIFEIDTDAKAPDEDAAPDSP